MSANAEGRVPATFSSVARSLPSRALYSFSALAWLRFGGSKRKQI
jgi:hypothetical protein